MLQKDWWKREYQAVLVAVFVLVFPGAPAQDLPSAQVLNRAVQEGYDRFKDVKDGANADYIPELAKVPSELFGVAIVTAHGDVFTAGDVDYAFTIQSVSKPFTAALLMQQQGSADVVADKIGVEPTGLPFNSILATQLLKPVSVNPLVNSGAIASVSLVKAKSAGERFDSIMGFFEQLAGAKLTVIEDVYKSEAATNQRNRAHAYILFVNDRIYSDPMEAVDIYTRQCSIGVSAKQLAVMGATLANSGVNPVTQQRVIDSRYVPKVLAIMMMGGFYNESGMWAYTAGLPAKTGVGGGIVAVAMKAIEYISDQLGVSVFGSGR
jgi:glutaminase